MQCHPAQINGRGGVFYCLPPLVLLVAGGEDLANQRQHLPALGWGKLANVLNAFPDTAKSLSTFFAKNRDHPALITNDMKLANLFWENDLALTKVTKRNIQEYPEGVYVLKTHGTSTAAGTAIENHVQSLVVDFDARVRTDGQFDRYIYDARDSVLTTNFESFDSAGNMTHFMVKDKLGLP